MKRSERILLAILIVGVLVWLGRGPVTRLFYEPIEQLNSQIEIVNRQIAQRELEEIELIASARQMKSRKRVSLPPDPLTAQRLYQSWLTDLALASGLQDLKITPESRNETDKAFVAVEVRLNANGTLAQIVRFLQEFHRTELLHRINSIDLDSDVTGRSPVIAVNLVAEGLSLTNAPKRNWLFPQTTLAEPISVSDDKIVLKEVSDFPEQAGFLVRLEEETLRVTMIEGTTWSVERGQDSSAPVAHQSGTTVRLIPTRPLSAECVKDSGELVAANPFFRRGPSVASADKPGNGSEPEIDEAQYTFLISAIADNEEREAWLFNRLNNSKHVIKENEAFHVAEIDGTLLKIQRDFVLVRYNNATWRLEVGDNLRALRREDE